MPVFQRQLGTWVILALTGLALASLGQGCPSVNFVDHDPVVVQPVVVPTTIDVELINQTQIPRDPVGFVVDPGLFVNGAAFVVDPPLDPGEAVALTFDCSAAITFQTDATVFADVAIASDNVPLVQQGVDFACGDTVSFIFVENGIDPFFTRVEVNGQFLTD